MDDVLTCLSDMWRDLLNVGTIDADRTFIEQGGDSIAATLCASRILSRYGVEISVSELLDDATTLRRVASRVEQLGSGTAV